MVCTNFLDLLTAVMTRPAGAVGAALVPAPRGSTRGNRVDIPLPLKRRLMIIGVPERGGDTPLRGFHVDALWVDARLPKIVREAALPALVPPDGFDPEAIA